MGSRWWIGLSLSGGTGREARAVCPKLVVVLWQDLRGFWCGHLDSEATVPCRPVRLNVCIRVVAGWYPPIPPLENTSASVRFIAPLSPLNSHILLLHLSARIFSVIYCHISGGLPLRTGFILLQHIIIWFESQYKGIHGRDMSPPGYRIYLQAINCERFLFIGLTCARSYISSVRRSGPSRGNGDSGEATLDTSPATVEYRYRILSTRRAHFRIFPLIFCS